MRGKKCVEKVSGQKRCQGQRRCQDVFLARSRPGWFQANRLALAAQHTRHAGDRPPRLVAIPGFVRRSTRQRHSHIMASSADSRKDPAFFARHALTRAGFDPRLTRRTITRVPPDRPRRRGSLTMHKPTRYEADSATNPRLVAIPPPFLLPPGGLECLRACLYAFPHQGCQLERAQNDNLGNVPPPAPPRPLLSPARLGPRIPVPKKNSRVGR